MHSIINLYHQIHLWYAFSTYAVRTNLGRSKRFLRHVQVQELECLRIGYVSNKGTSSPLKHWFYIDISFFAMSSFDSASFFDNYKVLFVQIFIYILFRVFLCLINVIVHKELASNRFRQHLWLRKQQFNSTTSKPP